MPLPRLLPLPRQAYFLVIVTSPEPDSVLVFELLLVLESRRFARFSLEAALPIVRNTHQNWVSINFLEVFGFAIAFYGRILH